jgi:uncharacterized protein DUF6455
MSSVLGIALSAVALSLTVALAFAFLAGWRRIMQDEGPLPLFAMLARRATAVDRKDLEIVTLALAARRCAFCGRKQECRAWLASAQPGHCPPYCPNAGVL